MSTARCVRRFGTASSCSRNPSRRLWRSSRSRGRGLWHGHDRVRCASWDRVRVARLGNRSSGRVPVRLRQGEGRRHPSSACGFCCTERVRTKSCQRDDARSPPRRWASSVLGNPSMWFLARRRRADIGEQLPSLGRCRQITERHDADGLSVLNDRQPADVVSTHDLHRLRH